MGKAKKQVIELIKQLPESSSLEDIQYHIYVQEKVERGLRDLKAGRILSQKEVERTTSTTATKQGNRRQ